MLTWLNPPDVPWHGSAQYNNLSVVVPSFAQKVLAYVDRGHAVQPVLPFSESDAAGTADSMDVPIVRYEPEAVPVAGGEGRTAPRVLLVGRPSSCSEPGITSSERRPVCDFDAMVSTQVQNTAVVDTYRCGLETNLQA